MTEQCILLANRSTVTHNGMKPAQFLRNPVAPFKKVVELGVTRRNRRGIGTDIIDDALFLGAQCLFNVDS